MFSLLFIFLCLVGLWISFYFTGVAYKWFSPQVAWVPPVCRFKEETCVAVLGTPRAKLFGIPNSVFGMGLYFYLLIGVVFPFPRLLTLFFLATALLRSVSLVYSLLFITKIPCILCFTGHVINLILFLIALNRVFL